MMCNCRRLGCPRCFPNRQGKGWIEFKDASDLSPSEGNLRLSVAKGSAEFIVRFQAIDGSLHSIRINDRQARDLKNFLKNNLPKNSKKKVFVQHLVPSLSFKPTPFKLCKSEEVFHAVRWTRPLEAIQKSYTLKKCEVCLSKFSAL